MNGFNNAHKEAWKALEAFKKSVGQQRKPDTIYHYTNASGLLGILTSKVLYATDIYMLNDPSELRHAAHKATVAVPHIAVEKSIDRSIRERIAAVVLNRIEEVAHFFACCFSKDGDEIGQWRAYADDGRGYSLGFDTEELEKAFLSEHPEQRSTFPIQYGDEVLRGLAAQTYEPLVSWIGGRDLANRDLDIQVAAAQISPAIITASLYFKHEDYEPEKEYRFLEITPADKVPTQKFRASGINIVRYLEFPWRTDILQALRTIYIGPAADQVSAARSLQHLLKEIKLEKHVEVRLSDIPYRSSR